MSGPFRSSLGPMLKRLTDNDQFLKSLLNKVELSDDDKVLLKNKEKEFGNLINDIEKKDDSWTQYIQDIDDNVKQETEEKKYSDFKFLEKFFYEWVDAAKVTLEAMIVVNRENDEDVDNRSSNGSTVTQVRTSRADNEIQILMPKLRLPEFKGDPHEWQSFWQSFDSSVHSRNYNGIDKMKFLLMCLHGDAKDAVSDIKLSNDNYVIAVEILTKRFGNKKILVESLEAELLQLPPAKDMSFSLKKTVDQIEKLCRQLKSFDKTIDNKSVWTSVIKSKLPSIVRLELAKKEMDCGHEWTTLELREELNNFVILRESIFTSMKHFKNAEQPSGFQKNSGGRNYQSSYQSRNNQQSFQKKKENFVQSFPAVQGNNQRNNWVPDCLFCEGNHWAVKCLKVVRPEDRMQRLADQERCFLCLRQGHKVPSCESRRNCQICNGKHHTVICRRAVSENVQKQNQGSSGVQVQFQPSTEKKSVGNRPKKEQSWSRKGPQTGKNKNFMANVQAQMQIGLEREEIPEVTETQEVEKTSNHLNIEGVKKPGDTILMAQKVPVFAPNCPGKVIEALVFFDTGSQTSYIQKSLVKKLNPPKVGEGILEVQGFQSQIPVRFPSSQYVVSMKKRDGKNEQLILFSSDKFTNGFKAVSVVNISDNPTLAEVKRNLEFINQEPDILIGIAEFWKFFVNRYELTPEFYLIETTVGPMVCGRMNLEPEKKLWKVQSQMVLNESQNEDAKLASTWWDLQSMGIRDDPNENEDETSVELFNKSIRKVDGRYRMKWLWREENPNLPSNYSLAYKCLESILRRMQSNLGNDMLEKYDGKIKEQLEKGIIEVAIRQPLSLEHYLPHHPVIRPGSTKLRLVYNASAKMRNGLSLNECMYRGPVLLPDLAGLLLRFRLPKYPLLADIEAAFLMLELEEEDREVTKFLWVKDINAPLTPKNLVIYRFQRVAFGVICSPYLLSATIQHHLKQYPNSEICKELWHSTYVDNVVMSCQSKEDILKKYHESKEIFSEASMNLREYVTNCPNVLEKIPEKDRLNNDKPKVLGIPWNLKKDELEIKFPKTDKSKNVTRRIVLQEMASLFDPLGLVSPCLVKPKLYFQKLWNNPQTWDESVSDIDDKNWKNLMDSWNEQEIKIPRRIVEDSNCENQLHIFVDASEDVYATVVYWRAEVQGNVNVSLLFSKNRLKPKHVKMTIPRMELLGLLIGVRAKSFVEKEMKVKIQSKHVWCDSKVVLSWLKENSEETKPRFVANRLCEIRTHQECTYRYVRSEDNPADYATRGMSPDELRYCKMWWNGPEWLKTNHSEWNNEFEVKFDKSLTEDDVVQRMFTGMAITHYNTDEFLLGKCFDLKRFSSWNKLLKTVSIVLKVSKIWLKKLKQARRDEEKSNSEISNINLNEDESDGSVEMAEKLLLRLAQVEMLEEIQKYELKCDPADKLWRLKTRIRGSDASKELESPVVIPKDNVILKLLIDQFHRKSFHAGVEATLSEFLSHYWTPRARKVVKSVVRSCQHCKRMRAYPYKLPIMPNLPIDRIRRFSPFESIGIDYLGPSTYKDENGLNKFYIVLITCLCTRAVYLEPVKDLSTKSFMLIFRRFVARRGCPRRILSDNGTQFVLASKVCELAIRPNNSSLKWKFINQLSPWQGGVYERLVALVKDAFKRTLGKRKLYFEELLTFVTEVETVLNNRPLTTVNDDLESSKERYMPLRPIDFIHPRANLNFSCDGSSESYPEKPAEKLIQSWKITSDLLDDFWKKWKKDYLIMLRERRERSKWFHKSPRLVSKETPKIGEVVIIEEEFKPRNLWQLGKIVEIVQGREPNIIRNVKVKFPNGKILSRPINRLYPLEVSDSLETEDDVEEVSVLEDEKVGPSEVKSDSENEEINVSKTERTINNYPKILTRRRAKTLGIKILPTILCLFFWLTAVFGSFQSNCSECEVDCIPKGIRIVSPENVHKLEICCGGGICTTHSRVSEFEYDIEKEILVNHHKCEVSFWTMNSVLLTAQVTCEPTNICDLVNCYLCIERIGNSNCLPWYTTVLLAISILSGICTSCCVIYLFRMCFCSTIVWKNIVAMFRILFFRSPRKRRKDEYEEENLLEGPGKRKRKASVQRILDFSKSSVLIILFLAKSNAEVVSVRAESEDCVRHHNIVSCVVNSVNTLTLLPSDQSVELLLKDNKGNAIGKLEIVMKALTMKCNAKTERWLRSYKVETYTVKRCPTMGSCDGDICEQIFPDTHLDELKEYEIFPGHNHCHGSCSFWWCGCGLATSSCLFYRNYALPVSDRIFELFSCPSWEFEIETNVKISLSQGNKTNEVDIKLIPGMSFHWNNVSITSLSVSVPPSPILSEMFLFDGESVVIVDELKSDLYCSTQYTASEMNCSLKKDSCEDCIPHHDEEVVECRCRNFDFENLFVDNEKRLPLTNSRLNLRNEGRMVLSETSYSPIQVLVRMKDLKISTISDLSKCTVSVNEFTGCYRCTRGAQLNVSCKTDEGEALAEITCPNDFVFTSKCDVMGFESVTFAHFDEADIHLSCKVECPGGETITEVSGHLDYIHIDEKAKFEIVKSRKGEITNDSSNIFSKLKEWFPEIELVNIIKLMSNWRYIVVLLTLVVLGLFFLYLVFSLRLPFKMFKLMSRIWFIIFILKLNLFLVGGSPLAMNHAWRRDLGIHEGSSDRNERSMKGRNGWSLFPIKGAIKPTFIQSSFSLNQFTMPGEHFVGLPICLELLNDNPELNRLEDIFLSIKWLELEKEFVEMYKNRMFELVTIKSKRTIQFKNFTFKSAAEHVVIKPNVTLESDEERNGRKLVRPNLPGVQDIELAVFPMEHVLLKFENEREAKRILLKQRGKSRSNEERTPKKKSHKVKIVPYRKVDQSNVQSGSHSVQSSSSNVDGMRKEEAITKQVMRKREEENQIRMKKAVEVVNQKVRKRMDEDKEMQKVKDRRKCKTESTISEKGFTSDDLVKKSEDVRIQNLEKRTEELRKELERKRPFVQDVVLSHQKKQKTHEKSVQTDLKMSQLAFFVVCLVSSLFVVEGKNVVDQGLYESYESSLVSHCLPIPFDRERLLHSASVQQSAKLLILPFIQISAKLYILRCSFFPMFPVNFFKSEFKVVNIQIMAPPKPKVAKKDIVMSKPSKRSSSSSSSSSSGSDRSPSRSRSVTQSISGSDNEQEKQQVQQQKQLKQSEEKKATVEASSVKCSKSMSAPKNFTIPRTVQKSVSNSVEATPEKDLPTQERSKRRLEEVRGKVQSQFSNSTKSTNSLAGTHSREASSLTRLLAHSREALNLIPRDGCLTVNARAQYWVCLERIQERMREAVGHASEWDSLHFDEMEEREKNVSGPSSSKS